MNQARRKKNKKRKKKSEPEKRNSGAEKTWCGEPVSPSSHHHHRVVYIRKKGLDWRGRCRSEFESRERPERSYFRERSYFLLFSFHLYLIYLTKLNNWSLRLCLDWWYVVNGME
jgi:hypothetical protein